MSGESKNNRKPSENSAIPKTSPRGNMDEYEAVRSIVSGNPGLLTRVLDKIRATRREKSGSTQGKPTEQVKK